MGGKKPHLAALSVYNEVTIFPLRAVVWGRFR